MSAYQISEQQKQDFLVKGFVRLENAIPQDLLERWQKQAKFMEDEGMSCHLKGDALAGCCVVDDPVGPRVMRCDDIHVTSPELSMELLSCPAMMAVARELCGRGAVPLQMDILYKQQHPHPVVKWHQGAPHPRNYPYLNIGIYLDDAPEGDGCLRYVPETQHALLDIEKVSKEHGWDVPGVVELPAKAGDVLIQDMMILHGSQPKRSEGVRRTIYVEYRPFEGIRESGAQSNDWMALRQHWMSQVLSYAEDHEWPVDWRGDYPDKVDDVSALMEKIHMNREPPIPAVWGTFPVETDDYPVPSDLR